MRKALLSIALLLTGMTMTMISCNKELTLEERIVEEEKGLTPQEKQLLHQTPAFDDWNSWEDSSFENRVQKVKETSFEEHIDGWSITKNGQGLVTQVSFDDITQRQPPADGPAFLTLFFGEEAASQFVKSDYATMPANQEMYVQYCGDLEVSYYCFTYDEQGIMRSAGGAYYPTTGLSSHPTISTYLARMIYASYLGQSVSLINEKPNLTIMLIPEENYYVPRLVYTLSPNYASGPTTGSKVAWVDAHSGRLLRVFFQFI